MSKNEENVRTSAVLEHVPPPRVLLGFVDADVIGHDVDDQAHPAGPRRSRQPRQPLGAAELGRDGGGIGDVVTVRGTLGAAVRIGDRYRCDTPRSSR